MEMEHITRVYNTRNYCYDIHYKDRLLLETEYNCITLHGKLIVGCYLKSRSIVLFQYGDMNFPPCQCTDFDCLYELYTKLTNVDGYISREITSEDVQKLLELTYLLDYKYERLTSLGPILVLIGATCDDSVNVTTEEITGALLSRPVKTKSARNKK